MKSQHYAIGTYVMCNGHRGQIIAGNVRYLVIDWGGGVYDTIQHPQSRWL